MARKAKNGSSIMAWSNKDNWIEIHTGKISRMVVDFNFVVLSDFELSTHKTATNFVQLVKQYRNDFHSNDVSKPDSV